MTSGKAVIAVSSGGVVYKKDRGEVHVCLIRRGRNVWCLPKGHVESGEKLSETARREILEETGLEVRPSRKIDVIHYDFREEDTIHSKTVHFFLCEYLKGIPEADEDEVLQARWFPVARALSRLTFKNEWRVLKKAQGMIGRSGGR